MAVVSDVPTILPTPQSWSAALSLGRKHSEAGSAVARPAAHAFGESSSRKFLDLAADLHDHIYEALSDNGLAALVITIGRFYITSAFDVLPAIFRTLNA